MICLTGDVHHSSLNSTDYQYCKGTEIDAATTMANVAREHGLELTLFFTGLCAREAPTLLSRIADFRNVEVGGHNYFAFSPRRPFNYYYRFSGLKNGPRWYQAWEVRRTIRAIEAVCKQPLRSWRDHAYRHDRNTRGILKQYGIRFISDLLSPDFAQPFWNQGVVDVPINTLPDHDYVYHGAQRPGAFNDSVLWQTAFKTGIITKEAWLERIMREVVHIEKTGGVATILTHPACMEVFDNFETFDKLCSFLKNFESCKMKDLPPERIRAI